MTGHAPRLAATIPKVAFVCPAAYPLFDPSCNALIGGMETRAALFARGLARSGGWRVLFAVNDCGQPPSVHRDQVELLVYDPLPNRIARNVVPRFRKHRWRPVIHLDRSDLHFLWQFPAHLGLGLLPQAAVHRFWRTLNPDIVCCFGNNPTSAETIAECYRNNIPTVLFIASDDDLSANYRPDARGLNDYGTPNWMAWYALDTADHIVVQTEQQQTLLRSNFGRSATLIHNPVEIAPESMTNWRIRSERSYILWIGRSDAFNKRPKLVLELAHQHPELPFLMVVNKSDPKILREIQENHPSNVTIVERVRHEAIPDLFRNARVYLNTSRYEGFPNTFLQAAAHGVPVVSLAVDPEGILTQHGCGYCAHDDFAAFGAKVTELWHDPSAASTHAERFFAHACRTHSLDSRTAMLADFLHLAITAPTPHQRSRRWLHPYTRFLRRC